MKCNDVAVRFEKGLSPNKRWALLTVNISTIASFLVALCMAPSLSAETFRCAFEYPKGNTFALEEVLVGFADSSTAVIVDRVAFEMKQAPKSAKGAQNGRFHMRARWSYLDDLSAANKTVAFDYWLNFDRRSQHAEISIGVRGFTHPDIGVGTCQTTE